MIKIKQSLSLLLLTLIFISCENDPTSNKESQKVNMQFGYSNVSESRSKAIDKTPAAIVITIEDASSTVVHQSLQLPVQNFNGNIVTQPLALNVGNYTITEYKVLNANDSVIYATPLEGSTAAALVSDALPINFTVSADGNTVISPEVLDTEQFVPADFGYTSSTFQIVPTFHFLVNVNYYDQTQGKYILTNSDIEVKSGNHTDFNESVAAETKVIEIRDFADSTYTVTVTKAGFLTWSNTYTNAEMKAFANLPLTIVIEVDPGPLYPNVYIDTDNGAVFVKMDGVLRGISNPTIYLQLFNFPITPSYYTQFSGTNPPNDLPTIGSNLPADAKLMQDQDNSKIYFIDAMPWDPTTTTKRLISTELINEIGFGTNLITQFDPANDPYPSENVPVATNYDNMNISYNLTGLHNLYGHYFFGSPFNTYFASIQTAYPNSSYKTQMQAAIANWQAAYNNLF